MAAKGGNIIGAILVFMSGVLFAYFTYPFFNALLTALDGVTAAVFDGWANISYLMWAGYFLVLVLWILVWPAYKIFGQAEG